MWRKILKKGLFLQIFGLSVPVLVYYQCNSPQDNTICRIFAENAAYIMLIFFMSGFVALAVKRPYFMLFSWLCTIILCQYLKGNAEGSFYYSKLQDKENAISVAHFKLGKTDEDLKVLKKIKSESVDLLSVSFNEEINSNVKDEIVRIYPYFTVLGSSENGENNYLFSKHKVSYFNDVISNEIYCSSGQIVLDSIEGKKISILCFSIDDKIADNPKKLNKSLVSISDLKKNAKVNEPLMVLGSVASYGWENELRTFRSNMLVNDSRLDLDLEKSGRHIFFSNQMKCVNYESFENGVIGTYEIRKPRKSQTQRDLIISAR